MDQNWTGFVCQYKKSSAWFSRYDLRFAVIKNGHMYIHVNETQFKQGKKSKETIPLRRVITSQAEEPRHPFVVVIKDRGEIHRLSFESNDDLTQCIKIIEATQRQSLLSTAPSITNDLAEEFDITPEELDKACGEVLKGLGIPAQRRQEMLENLSMQQKMDIVVNQTDKTPPSRQTTVLPNIPEKIVDHTRNVSYWIKQLRIPKEITPEILVDISDRLVNENMEWLQEFINEQGLTLLIQSMPIFKGRTEHEVEFLRCFRAIIDKRNGNDKVGLHIIITHEYALQAVIDLLDNEDIEVRLFIIKLLSAICWHDEMGFEKVISCLDQYAKDKHLSSFWVPFIQPLLPMVVRNPKPEKIEEKQHEVKPTHSKSIAFSFLRPASPKPREGPTTNTEDEYSYRPPPSFEFQLYTIGLLNAILNSFTLEDRVNHRKELGALGIEEVLSKIEEKIDGIIGFGDDMDEDPLISKMEEQLELYRSVESIDMRESTLGRLDMSSPKDLFDWLEAHAVKEGYLNEFTHILQCLTTIPSSGAHIWTTLERVVSCATAPIRKNQMKNLLKQSETDPVLDNAAKNDKDISKTTSDLDNGKIQKQIDILESDPGTFPTFEELKALLGKYDEDVALIDMNTEKHKRKIDLLEAELSNLKSMLTKNQLLVEQLIAENKQLISQKRRESAADTSSSSNFSMGLQNLSTMFSKNKGKADSTETDGKTETEISKLNPTETQPPPPTVSSPPVDDEPEALKPFLKMKKIGVPMASIENKMRAQGIEPQLLHEYLSKPKVTTNATSSGAGNATTNNEPAKSEVQVPPELAPFLKQLKMGVPRAGVENKMRAQGLDPQLLNQYQSGISIPQANTRSTVTSSGGGGGGGGGGNKENTLSATKPTEKKIHRKSSIDELPADLKPKSTVAPSVKMRQLHWTKVNPKEVKGTIWEGLDDDQLQMDIRELETLFQAQEIKPKPSSGTPVPEKKKDESIHLIDSKRSYNVDIGLSRIKMPHQRIRDAILSMDETTLNLDKISKLSNYVPTPDEVETITGYEGDSSSLGNTEQFFLALSVIPNVPERLQLWEFKLRFKELVDYQNEKIAVLRKAHDSVKNSKAFRDVLRYILKVGNYMNGGTKKGQAYGFKLSSLKQLAGAKTADNTMTLMEYLTILLDKNEKSALKFLEEFIILEEASRVDMSQLAAEVNKIGANLNLIKKRVDSKVDQNDRRNLFGDVMTHFLKSNESEYQQLKNRYDKIKSDCVKLAEFLNQGNDIQMELFKLLNEFRQLFIKAQETVAQREQQRLKAEKQQKSHPKGPKKAQTTNDVFSKSSSSNGSGSATPYGDELNSILKKRKVKVDIKSMAHAADEREKQELRNSNANRITVEEVPIKLPPEPLEEKDASSVTDGILDLINPASAERRRGISQYKKPMGTPLIRPSSTDGSKQTTSQRMSIFAKKNVEKKKINK